MDDADGADSADNVAGRHSDMPHGVEREVDLWHARGSGPGSARAEQQRDGCDEYPFKFHGSSLKSWYLRHDLIRVAFVGSRSPQELKCGE